MSDTPHAAFAATPLRIVLIQPAGYRHSAALAELAETLLYGLDGLGVAAEFAFNDTDPEALNVVLGAHLLTTQDMARLPSTTVIYNSEQIDDSSAWISGPYVELLRRCRVWDYSPSNVTRLAQKGVGRVCVVPVGYVAPLTRIPVASTQDIDVLFYGGINERRKQVLEGLIARGLRIEFLSGVYQEERDAYIARAKVILNIHYYPASVFEIVRVSYLLANRKAVVAECNESTSIEADIREAVCAVPYEDLVNACAELVADAPRRAVLEQRGFDVFTQRDASRILGEALNWTLSTP